MNTRGALIFAIAVLAGPAARANTVLFDWLAYYNGSTVSTTGTPNDELAGTVAFSTVLDTTYGANNYDLVITITNTAPDQPPQSSWLLDGVFFDIKQGTTGVNGVVGTTPGSLPLVTAYTGTTVTIDSKGNTATTTNYSAPGDLICSPVKGGGNTIAAATGSVCANSLNQVSGGWEEVYNNSSTGVGGASTGTYKPTQDWGLGTTGMSNIFNGNDVGGFNYAVLPSAGVTPTSSNKGTVFAENSVTITLDGLTSSSIFISQVQAAYGTAPEAITNTVLVSGEGPEPGTIVMMGVGATLLLFLKRRRRNS